MNRTDYRNRGKIFSCPMHPEVQAQTPGTCPKCGMKLVIVGHVQREA